MEGFYVFLNSTIQNEENKLYTVIEFQKLNIYGMYFNFIHSLFEIKLNSTAQYSNNNLNTMF